MSKRASSELRQSAVRYRRSLDCEMYRQQTRGVPTANYEKQAYICFFHPPLVPPRWFTLLVLSLSARRFVFVPLLFIHIITQYSAVDSFFSIFSVLAVATFFASHCRALAHISLVLCTFLLYLQSWRMYEVAKYLPRAHNERRKEADFVRQ